MSVDLQRDRAAKAAAHPLRRGILEAMAEREPRSPAELAVLLRDHLHNVSYHVKRLEQLGQVELVKERQVRGAIEHFYSRTAAGRRDTDDAAALDAIVEVLREDPGTGRAAAAIARIVKGTGRVL